LYLVSPADPINFQKIAWDVS